MTVALLIQRLTQATQNGPMADSADVEAAATVRWTNFNRTLVDAVHSSDVRKWAEGPPSPNGTFPHGRRKLSLSANDPSAEAWAVQNGWHRQAPINATQWRHDDACPTCARRSAKPQTAP